MLFFLLAVGLLLRALHPVLGLSPASFALVYAALMVATVIPTMGFGGYFLPFIAGLIYYATPENNWEEVLWPHVPEWVVPRDPELIRRLFEGLSAGESIPWEPWVVPVLVWASFFVAFSGVSLSFVSLVHHQWSREERLVYPLAATPTLMVESLRDPSRSFLRSRLLWAGFLLAWSYPTVNLFDQLFDISWIENFGIPSAHIRFRSPRPRLRPQHRPARRRPELPDQPAGAFQRLVLPSPCSPWKTAFSDTSGFPCPWRRSPIPRGAFSWPTSRSAP